MSGSQTFPKLSQQALDEHRQIHFHLDLLAKLHKPLLDHVVTMSKSVLAQSLRGA